MFCHRTVIAYILFKLVLEKLQPREDCGKPAQWLDMIADIEMLKLLHKFCATFSSDMAHKKVWISGYQSLHFIQRSVIRFVFVYKEHL
jgi:hypothetical protein